MSVIDSVIAWATTAIGRPYNYGDAGPNTFDCSGLTMWAYAHEGIQLPHNAAEQQKVTTPVATPAPGDLVFYGRPAHHVALYVGGGQQIAAPHSGATVTLQPVSSGASYGRVSGSGAAFAPVVDLMQTGLGDLAEKITGARETTLQVVVVVAGLALVGVGGWKLFVKPAGQKLGAL